MKPILALVLSSSALVSLLCAQLVPEGPNARLCSNTVDCNTQGTALLKAKNLAGAIADFFEELRDAEEGRNELAAADASAVVLAFNNLGAAYLRQRDFLRARYWVLQALDLDPDNAAVARNLAEVNASMRSFSWPGSPRGSYLSYVGCGESNEIRISKSTTSTAKISFQGTRIGARGCHSEPAALGEMEGEAVLQAKSAVYKGAGETASCMIELEIQPDSLSVEEDGQCGFGYGVHATGEYLRVSVQ